MQGKNYNILLSKNEAFELTVVFTDSGDNPIPLSAESGETKMQVRTQNDVNSTLIATVNSSTSTLANWTSPVFYYPPGTTNTFVLYIPQSSIEGAPFNGMQPDRRYFYDIVAHIDRIPRSPKIILSGTIKIESGITDVP